MHTLSCVTPDVLHGALDAGGVGVWLYDRAGEHAEWSEAMARMHGIAHRTGPAVAVFERVVPDDRRGIDEAVAHAADLVEPVAIEYRVDVPGGGVRWISTTVSSYFGGNSGSVVISAIATDITDRKELELSTSRRRAMVEGLQWVSQAIIAGQGLADTAAALLESASDVLGASSGVMVYRAASDDDADVVDRASTGFTMAEPSPDRFVWPTITGTTDGATVIGDAAAFDGVTELLQSFGFPDELISDAGSVLLVPIGRTQLVGVMCFVRDDVGYFDDDADLASAIGSTAAAAIESAHRYEQQRIAAKTFQQHLLPAADLEIEGIELCTQYHPGRDGLDVGGDWFDVLDLGDRVGLAVGDVCGHGLQAAAHMGQLRYSFRALMQLTPDAEAALGVLNDTALELGTTATVAYVELDKGTGACEVWRCGHPPPVVAAADGSAARWLGELGDGGPMLGFVDRISCDPILVDLPVGDVLLLYTDGLVERREEAIDIGLDRLASALADTMPIDDLRERCVALHEVLDVAHPDADDVALVAVRRR